MQAGNLVIEPDEYLVYVDDTPLMLTVREFGLLVEFARRGGKVITREELYDAVWHQPYRRSERSVDVYVGKLRHKLEEASPDWQYIHTHFGFGYRFDPQPRG
jgi:DNA-binding response OmpR family regulator